MHADWSAVSQRIWDLAEPLASAHGLEVVDVQFRPENGRAMLRVLLDRPEGGVTIDELTRASRELGDVLDGHDAIPGRYQLECSSPGLNRPLVRPHHWSRAIGERVFVRTRAAIEGRRTFHGTVVETDGREALLQDPDAGAVRIELAEIEKANIEYDFSRPTRGASA
jgi:ribosome maturation factor RimP